MIKFENTEVVGWVSAIRGMRNPMNSWEKSDSGWSPDWPRNNYIFVDEDTDNYLELAIGPNDQKLMTALRNAGTDHRKFMRMITVYVDITAPLYWWKEFDTYKVGTVANSCSTMHKIADKEFTIDDFSHEHLVTQAKAKLEKNVDILNGYRDIYVNWARQDEFIQRTFDYEKKLVWWQLIQLLPSSYNQKRTVMLNYEVLANIYKSRKNHKLDEWSFGFIEWIRSLPYSELITGGTING